MRLSLLESMLDQDTFVLGVDEHTAVVIDLDAESCTVAGNGTVTVRHKSTSRVFETGEVFPLDVLRNPTAEHTTGKTSAKTAITGDEQKATADNTATSLGHVTATCTERFNEALDARDPITAVRAALELEQAIHEWSADSLQSEDADRARAALRAMISNLGDLAVGGARDPRDVVAPFVEALLSLRATVRAEKRFDLSDTIRDAFTDIGVEVRDTPSGVEWQLRD
jgi:cysteinyl-tRNA synthetase